MSKKNVTLQKIIEAAEEVAREDGYINLSLVKIAERLDIKSPSLFNHVKGLEEIRKHVTLLGLQRLRDEIEEAIHEKAGEAAVVQLAMAYRDFSRRQPSLYESIRGVGPKSEADLADAYYALMKIMVKVFETDRMVPDEQVHQARALRAMLHGWVELERAGSFHLVKDIDWSFARMVSAFAKSAFENT